MRIYRRVVASCFFILAALLLCQALIQIHYGEPYPAVWAPGFAAGATDRQSGDGNRSSRRPFFSVGGLALYRILYATAVLLMGLPKGLWIPLYGSAFFRPPFGFTWFLDHGVPPEWFFLVLNAAAAVSAVMLLTGYRTRIASLALFVTLLSLNAWRYSFGKIDHDLLIIAVPLILAFSGWGDRLSVDSLAGHRVRFYTNSPCCSYWPWLLL